MNHKKAIEIFKNNILYVTICEKDNNSYTQNDCIPLIHIPILDFTNGKPDIHMETLKSIFSDALEKLNDIIVYNAYYIQWSRDAPQELKKYFISTELLNTWVDALKTIALLFSGVSNDKLYYQSKIDTLSRLTAKAVNISTMRSVESEIDLYKRKLNKEIQIERETIESITNIMISNRTNELFERMNYAICFENDSSTARSWCLRYYSNNGSKIVYLEKCLDKSTKYGIYIDESCTSCSSVCDEEIHMWIQLLKL